MANTQNEDATLELAKAGFGLVVGVGAMFLDAYVAKTLWNWFVTPLGVMSLTFVGAMGLGIFIKFMTTNSYLNAFLMQDKNKPEYMSRVLGAPIAALVFWGIGALVHLYM